MSAIPIPEKLHEAFRQSGIISKWNEPLSAHTSFRIGGEAALCVFPTGRAQLITVLSLWREFGDGCPICILGNGSNVLVADKGYHGLVVITTRARRVVFEEDNAPDREAFRMSQIFCQVHAECGASLTGLAALAMSEERELSGLEFAYGIPGSVGGAVVMNAGAYGGAMDQVILSAEYFDLSTGEIVRLSDTEMDLDYRHSVFLDHPERVVLTAVLKLSYGNGEDIRARSHRNMESRQEKQPLNYPSAGSVFKRPTDNYAGRMVESVGLKGAFEGAAQVSDKHAGFIVHRTDVGVASADDILRLIARVRRAVREVYRYDLECEIRYISDEFADRAGVERYLMPEPEPLETPLSAADPCIEEVPAATDLPAAEDVSEAHEATFSEELPSLQEEASSADVPPVSEEASVPDAPLPPTDPTT